jgi:signal transduction histidine kinase
MTQPASFLADPLLETPGKLTPAERTAIDQFEDQRRLNLLRVLVPGFFILVALSLPAAIFSDIQGALNPSTFTNGATPLNFHFYGSTLTMLSAIGLGISFYAMINKRVNLAAYSFFGAITVSVISLIFTDSFLPGPLALHAMGDFGELVLPIILAGLLAGSRTIVFTILATVAATGSDIFLAQHDPFLTETLKHSDGFSVIIVPIALQVATGIIMFAASRGLRQTQRELNSVRVAYAREKELDRLKNRFISNVNHELRTPIMALQGYLTIARELGNRGDLQRQALILDHGMEALDNLSLLVESVLKVRLLEAEGGTLSLVPVDLRDAIDRAILLLDPRETGERERPLRLDLPQGVQVMAQQEKLIQVVLNLLSNACKYSPQGTPIDIRARIVPPAGKGTPALEVTVRDYGLGIPPEQIPLLFGRFVRLDRDITSTVGGTGLGLAITKSTVEAMGGKIWVESNGIEGDGSSFIFTLTLAQEPAPLVPSP